MRKFKMLVMLAVMAAFLTSLLGAATASAVTWRPQAPTTVAASSSNSRLTDSNGNTVSCTSSTTNLSATGNVATARAASGNPVDYSGCSNSLGLSPTTVATAGSWTFTANSTTDVTASASIGSGNVATITLGGFCSIRAASATITGNGWANGTPASTLTLNGAARFALTNSGCLGLVGSQGSLSGTYSVTGGSIA